MMGLAYRIVKAVLIRYTRVTDGRTDRQTELAWHIRAMAYMLLRVIKVEKRSRANISGNCSGLQK